MVNAASPRKEARAEISDDVLRGFIGYRMKRAFNVLQADLHRVLKPYNLRMVSYSALALIVENPGARQSELADALAIERPNLVVLLDGLEEAGLIRREKVPQDRRAYALMPTPKGSAVAARASAAIRADEARLLQGVDAEARRVAIEVMTRIEKG